MVLCLLFVVWFASGAVLSFVPFPSLGDHDRLAGADSIDLGAVAVTPAAALKAAGGGDDLRLISRAGRPVYVARRGKAGLIAIDAATGQRAPTITPVQALGIASHFAGAPAASATGPLMYDQWVTHQNFDPQRPFYRVALGDRLGTQVYVSARTGEIVQRTTASARGWNWVGAVVHWLYFTALRKSFTAWDQTVWWVSLVGVATAVVGTWLGLYRTWKRMRGRRPDWSPFRGWIRWHHGVGLGVALFVLTWMISGWLSMDHGRLFSRGYAGPAAEAVYAGAPLDQALGGVGLEAMKPLGQAKRISFTAVGGRAVIAAEGGSGGPRVVLSGPSHAPTSAAPSQLLTMAAAKAWPLSNTRLHGRESGDELYRLAEGFDDRAVRLDVTRPRGAGLYIDPVTGRILALVDDSRKAYAWIYFAVHTFNFPFLIDRPILRRVLELIPLTFGFLFSLTGVVIAVKRLRVSLPS